MHSTIELFYAKCSTPANVIHTFMFGTFKSTYVQYNVIPSVMVCATKWGKKVDCEGVG